MRRTVTVGVFVLLAAGLVTARTEPAGWGSSALAGTPPVSCGSIAGNLVQNCGFEAPAAPADFYTVYGPGSTDIPGWTVATTPAGGVDLTTATFGGAYPVHGGGQSVDLGHDGPGGIYQDLATTPGQFYEVVFFLSGYPMASSPCGGQDPKTLTVTAGSRSQNYTFAPVGVSPPGNQPFTRQTLNFVASGGTTRLIFTSTTPGCVGPIIDDVSVVVTTATPTLTATLIGTFSCGDIAGNLVQNCGVELPALPAGSYGGYGAGSTDILSWTVLTTPNGGVDLTTASFFGGFPVHGGVQSVDLGHDFEGGLFQDLATTPGQFYELAFFVSGYPAALAPCGAVDPKTLMVTVGSVTQNYSFAPVNGTPAGSQPFDRHTLGFTASGSTTRLTFTSSTPGCAGPILDDVSVVPAVATSVPTVTGTPTRTVTGTPTRTRTATPTATPTPDPFDRVVVYLQGKDGRFGEALVLPPPVDGLGTVDLLVGDVTGDSLLDVLVAGVSQAGTGLLARYNGDGNGGFESPSVFPLRGQPVDMDGAFINQNGILDVAVAERAAALSPVDRVEYFRDGQFGPAPEFTQELAAVPRRVALGRVTNDDLADLAVGLEGGTAVQVIRRLPTPTATATAIGTVSPSPTGVPTGTPLPGQVAEACNVGGVPLGLTLARSNLATGGGVDQDLDLFALVPAGVRVIENAGSPTFPAGTFCPPDAVQTTLGGGANPVAFLMVDVNSDQQPDVLILDRQAGAVHTYQTGFTPSGYTEPATSPVGSTPVDLAAIELVPNAAASLVVAHWPSALVATGGVQESGAAGATAGSISVLRGDGSGAFAPQQSLPLQCGPSPHLRVATGDLNRDGRGDIVVAGCRPVAVSVTPSPTPTAGAAGHGFTLTIEQGDRVRLSWRAGVSETGVIGLRWSPESGFAFLPPSVVPIPRTQTSYLDEGPLLNPAYCYLLLVVGGNPPSISTVLGLTDLLCVYPREESQNAPQGWSVHLDEWRPTQTRLNWSGPGGQDRYLLTVRHFDGSGEETIPLAPNVRGYTEETGGRSTCYQLRAMVGTTELGRTDTICAVPGIGALPAGGTGMDSQLRSVLEGVPPLR